MATYEETYGKLTELQRMIVAMRRRSKESSAAIDATRARVLALLKMHDGISLSDMSIVLDLRAPNLGEAIEAMEVDGLVERRPSEDDGRIMLVFLTETGSSAGQPKADLPRQLLCDFSDEELAALDGYLDRMSAKLLEELGEDWKEQEEQARQNRDKPRGDRREGRGGRDDRRGFDDKRGGRDERRSFGDKRGERGGRDERRGGRGYGDDRKGGNRYGSDRRGGRGYGDRRDDRRSE